MCICTTHEMLLLGHVCRCRRGVRRWRLCTRRRIRTVSSRSTASGLYSAETNSTRQSTWPCIVPPLQSLQAEPPKRYTWYTSLTAHRRYYVVCYALIVMSFYSFPTACLPASDTHPGAAAVVAMPGLCPGPIDWRYSCRKTCGWTRLLWQQTTTRRPRQLLWYVPTPCDISTLSVIYTWACLVKAELTKDAWSLA